MRYSIILDNIIVGRKFVEDAENVSIDRYCMIPFSDELIKVYD